MDGLDVAVASLMRAVARAAILPRFRALETSDIGEKAPGEVVTIADREAEAALADGLARLEPAVRIIGEEAVDADPSLLDGIGEGQVWLIDPLDGTRNFARGDPHFAVMIALVDNGRCERGWILHPLDDVLWRARRGGGAWRDGDSVVAAGTGVPGLIGALPGWYAPPAERPRLEAAGARLGRMLPGLMCAGADYPRTIDGTQDFAQFWKSMPWDHAAGSLLLAEAGGMVARADGTPFRVDDRRPGLLAAASPAIWADARALLYGD